MSESSISQSDRDPAELLARVRELTPVIAASAELAEQQRQPVDAVIEALSQAGVFRAYVQKRYGGYEIDTDTFIDIGVAISEACTSTGVMHADWVLLNGVVEGNPFEPRLFITPRDQIQVEDTWYCAGMEGTGSNDMIADDVFIPAARSESLLAMSMGRGSGASSSCYRHLMLPLLSIAAAIPALGAARRALELFTQRLGGRLLRDVNALSCHTVFDTEISAENYVRVLLGMDPASPV
jgi:alkylation response protein AidB-like acyl-CoA dehydrogenase